MILTFHKVNIYEIEHKIDLYSISNSVMKLINIKQLS